MSRLKMRTLRATFFSLSYSLCIRHSVAKSWEIISAKSTEKFCRTHYPFREAVLHRLLPQNSNKNFELIIVLNRLFLPIMMAFYVNNIRPLFGRFWKNLQIIRSRIFSAADIFMRPHLCFAAEMSAIWQHLLCTRQEIATE
jgi:hypothetical protein